MSNATPKTRNPGSFRWQDDPNYRGPDTPPPRTIAPAVPPMESGPSVMDYAVAAKGMRDTGKANGKLPARGKGAARLTDAAGSLVGTFSDDAGNQIQSRAAGMRMENDPAQAQSARDAYVQAFNATDDAGLKQQYADAAANIAKGASVDVPDAVQGGATLAGTLAEGTSKAVPLLVGLGLSGFKDGGAVVGGIGLGLMQGASFIHQKRQADALQGYRDQSLDMQRQQLQMQQDFHKLKMDEAARVNQIGALTGEIAKSHPDADPYQRQRLIIDEGVKRNLFRGDELDKAYAARSKLRTEFGTQAYDAALLGDIKPLQSLLGERGISADFAPDGRGINLWSAASKRDPQGNLLPIQTLSIEGLQQLDAMGAVREREIARQKAAAEGAKNGAELGKTFAETDRLRADATLKRATAAGKNEYTLDDNGNVVRNPNYRAPGSKGGAAGAMSPEDFAKAMKDYVPEGEAFDMADAYATYTNMLENTRDGNGLPLTEGQKATAWRDFIKLVQGNGVRTPNIGRDGKLELTGDVAGRTYTLDPDFTERQALALTDAEGKPRYSAETINDLYLDALRTNAVTSPKQFEAAWLIANDPEALRQVEEAARSGVGDERKRAIQALSLTATIEPPMIGI